MLQELYPLLLLACPIAMGLMMWMMMRGNKQQTPTSTESREEELTRLRAEVDQLRAAQLHDTTRHQETEPGYR